MPDRYFSEEQNRAIQRDLETIEERLSSNYYFLDFGVGEPKYISPSLMETEKSLSYRDYLDFLATTLRHCIENGTVSEATQEILKAYQCPHLPHALTPPVMRTAKVIPLFAKMVN